MSKEYQYKKNIRLGSIINIVTILSLFLISLFLVQVLDLMGKLGFSGSPLKVFMVLMFGAALLLFVLVSIKDYIYMARIRVSVESDAITYKGRRKEKKISFNTISHLKFHLFSSDIFSSFDSWIKIVSESNTIKISIGLQNFGDLLQELKNTIDQQELSINYDRKKFFRFFKMAVYLDQGWARMYLIVYKFIVITILSAIIGTVYAILSQLSSFVVISWWIFLSIAWSYICYYYTEEILKHRLVKQMDEQSFTYPPRDIAYEKVLYRKVLIFGTLIYIVASTIAVIILRSIGGI